MATTFTDHLGNEWDLSINLGAAKRIESADFSDIVKNRKISLFNPDKEFFNSIIVDTRCIALMIWCIIKPIADKKGILHERIYSDDGDSVISSPEDAIYFEDILGGKALYAAKEAFWDACSDFFQQQGISLTPLVDTLKDIQRETLKTMEKMRPKIQSIVNKELNQILEEFEKGGIDAT